MKLIDLLREIGEATAKPYRLDQTVRSEDFRLDQYEFTTDKGNEYAIQIRKDTHGSETDYNVSFGLREPEEEDVYQWPPSLNTEKEVNDPKNMFRVMATVLVAVKRSIEHDEESGKTKVTTVIMNPTKRDKGDTRRTQLYKKYIQKELGYDPETKRYRSGVEVHVEPDGSKIQIDLYNTQ